MVSRLIADDGLPASHDQPTGTIVVHHVEPTRLQVGQELQLTFRFRFAVCRAALCIFWCVGVCRARRRATLASPHLSPFHLHQTLPPPFQTQPPQTLAGTFSDKASLLVELNERALAMHTGAPPC